MKSALEWSIIVGNESKIASIVNRIDIYDGWFLYVFISNLSLINLKFSYGENFGNSL